MSAPRSLNALQVAERLIGLGLCPVALRSPNDPSEQQKPAAKRGKTPFLTPTLKPVEKHSKLPESNVT